MLERVLPYAKTLLSSVINEGDIAVDATAGNGHDTLFLSNTVKESGHVYAFDIQEGALISTKKRLETEGQYENYTLIHDSHHNLKKYIDRKIKAGMFNLGYLPGAGKKELTTKRSSTLPAVKSAIEMLGEDSILLVAVYPGHPEGAAEGVELTEYFETISRFKYSIACFRMVNSPESPFFFVIETK